MPRTASSRLPLWNANNDQLGQLGTNLVVVSLFKQSIDLQEYGVYSFKVSRSYITKRTPTKIIHFDQHKRRSPPTSNSLNGLGEYSRKHVETVSIRIIVLRGQIFQASLCHEEPTRPYNFGIKRIFSFFFPTLRVSRRYFWDCLPAIWNANAISRATVLYMLTPPQKARILVDQLFRSKTHALSRI